MNLSSSLDQGAEDASGYRRGLGGRKPLLDRLWPGCHRGGSDVRSALQDAHLWHDRRALRHCGGSTERVGDDGYGAYTTNDFCLGFFFFKLLCDFICRLRTMYWADWGNHPKIETAAMDGTLRQTLVHENIQWPTGQNHF